MVGSAEYDVPTVDVADACVAPIFTTVDPPAVPAVAWFVEISSTLNAPDVTVPSDEKSQPMIVGETVPPAMTVAAVFADVDVAKAAAEARN